MIESRYHPVEEVIFYHSIKQFFYKRMNQERNVYHMIKFMLDMFEKYF
jgi:hypothetical protein